MRGNERKVLRVSEWLMWWAGKPPSAKGRGAEALHWRRSIRIYMPKRGWWCVVVTRKICTFAIGIIKI